LAELNKTLRSCIELEAIVEPIKPPVIIRSDSTFKNVSKLPPEKRIAIITRDIATISPKISGISIRRITPVV
jgi:hypothetical protein